MMKFKTESLEAEKLDYWVARAKGWTGPYQNKNTETEWFKDGGVRFCVPVLDARRPHHRTCAYRSVSVSGMGERRLLGRQCVGR